MTNKQFIIQFLEDEDIRQVWYCSHNVHDSFWKLVGFMGYLTKEDAHDMCEFTDHPSHDYRVLMVDEARDWFNNLFHIDSHATSWPSLAQDLLGYWETVANADSLNIPDQFKNAKLRKNRVILRIEEFGEEFTGLWQNSNYTAIIERYTRRIDNDKD